MKLINSNVNFTWFYLFLNSVLSFLINSLHHKKMAACCVDTSRGTIPPLPAGDGGISRSIYDSLRLRARNQGGTLFAQQIMWNQLIITHRSIFFSFSQAAVPRATSGSRPTTFRDSKGQGIPCPVSPARTRVRAPQRTVAAGQASF
jgi:hypothetical protein